MMQRIVGLHVEFNDTNGDVLLYIYIYGAERYSLVTSKVYSVLCMFSSRKQTGYRFTQFLTWKLTGTQIHSVSYMESYIMHYTVDQRYLVPVY